MSKYGILFDIDKCIACQACFAACKEENQTAPKMNWVTIAREEDRRDRIISYYRVSCQHCDSPACMKVCPVKAVRKGAFGEVLVDQEKCIGCHACLAACPYGVPQFNETGAVSYWPGKAPLAVRPEEPHHRRIPGKAEHCTLCSHRLAEGKLPACVEYCTTGALRLIDYENLTPEETNLLERAQKMTAAAGTEPKVRYLSTRVAVAEKRLKASAP